MNEPFVVAILTVIVAGILWKFVFRIPFVSGYGVGQRSDNSVESLFKEHKERVPAPQREVIHLCGSLNSKLWKQDSWIQWLNDVKEKAEITTRVIAGPRVDTQSKDIIKEMIDKNAIELRILEKREEMHLLIVDRDWAHIEECHVGRKIPKGLCVKHLFPGAQRVLYEKFEELWNKAKPVAIENIENIFTPSNEYSKEIEHGRYPCSVSTSNA
jgi:hypothetical protein